MRSSTSRGATHAPIVKGKAAHPPNKHHVPGAAAAAAEKDDFIVSTPTNTPLCSSSLHLPPPPPFSPSTCHPPLYPLYFTTNLPQVNLKGSIYLLTLENEMLKKAVQTGGAGPKSTAAMTGSSTFGNSATNPVHTSASLLSSQLPNPEYPSEIGDAFEMMRQKYTQVRSRFPCACTRRCRRVKEVDKPTPCSPRTHCTTSLSPLSLSFSFPAGAQVPA